ncbi:MAG: acyltransferase domain-containing protein, partial [bacterium]
PFYVVDELSPWERSQQVRRAGVSAFGMGGVNAHVVLEEAPLRPSAPGSARPVELLRLSAQSPEALQALAGAYAEVLGDAEAQGELAHLVHTANRGRASLRYRGAVVGADASELAEALGPYASGARLPGRRGAKRPKLAFLFTGQGSQYPRMAQDLAAVEPVVAASLAASAAVLEDRLAIPLEEVLADPGGEALAETRYAQVGIAALQWALVELLRSWGIRPDLVLGHSLGEYVGAACAGVFSWPDALRLIARRGEARSGLPADATTRHLGALEASSASRAPALPILGPDGPRSAETMAAIPPPPEEGDPLGSRRRLLDAARDGGTDVVWELSVAPAPEEDPQSDGTLHLRALVAGRRPLRSLLQALVDYYTAGYDEIDWRGFEALPGRRRVPAPHYPFRKERYWHEAAPVLAPPALPTRESHDGARDAAGEVATTTVVAPPSPDAGSAWEVSWQPAPAAREGEDTHE